jgi:Uncharacterised protein conserved in bacteria (DUF2336)
MTTKDTVARLVSHSEKDEARCRRVLDEVAHGYVLIEDAITEFADADVVRGIALLIALRLELETDAVVRALDVGSDEPATVLCRAAALNINVFSAVLRMRRRRRSSDLSPPEALNAFRQLSVETAQRILRATPWQVLHQG